MLTHAFLGPDLRDRQSVSETDAGDGPLRKPGRYVSCQLEHDVRLETSPRSVTLTSPMPFA